MQQVSSILSADDEPHQAAEKRDTLRDHRLRAAALIMLMLSSMFLLANAAGYAWLNPDMRPFGTSLLQFVLGTRSARLAVVTAVSALAVGAGTPALSELQPAVRSVVIACALAASYSFVAVQGLSNYASAFAVFYPAYVVLALMFFALSNVNGICRFTTIARPLFVALLIGFVVISAWYSLTALAPGVIFESVFPPQQTYLPFP